MVSWSRDYIGGVILVQSSGYPDDDRDVYIQNPDKDLLSVLYSGLADDHPAVQSYLSEYFFG